MVNNNDTVTLPRSVVEQALEALTNCTSEYSHRCNRCDSEVDPDGNVASVLRAALDRSNRQSVHESELMMNDASYRRKFEQPQVEQEPFLWLDQNFGDIWDKDAIARDEKPDGLLPLYTNPQPPRQPLMEEEICKLMVSGDYLTVKGLTKFVRDIELAHGIKEQK